MVWPQKLCNFQAIGFYRVSYEGSKLEIAAIKFWDLLLSSTVWTHYQDVIETMFSQLGSANILSIDLVTIQVALYPFCLLLWNLHYQYLYFIQLACS